MFKILFITAFLLLAVNLKVRSETLRRVTKGPIQYYLIQYQQGEYFFVDVYKVGADGFQNRESHFRFSDLAQAQSKILVLTKRLEKMPIPPPLKNPAKPYATIKLWPVTQEWTEDWEDRYTTWMKINLTTKFLFNHNIQTDCADVPVTYRWLFAMLNGLPAGNSLAGSGVLFTQDSAPASWEQLPTHENWWQNQRFLKAIEYLQDNTYTKSVFNDLYPVKIDNRSVSAGAVWLINEQHAYNVGQIDFNSFMWMKMYSSTVPRKRRELMVSSFDFSKPTLGLDGFQRPRWVKKIKNKWSMITAENMPWYSLEQYSDEFSPDANLFAPVVYQKLSGKPIVPSQWLQGLMTNLYNSYNARRAVVEDGFAACHPNRCAADSDLYDVHSTPSRDRRILETISRIKDFIKNNPGHALDNQWDYFQNFWGITIYGSEDSLGHYLSVRDLVLIWENKKFSSDPNQRIEIRWGI